MIQWVTRSPIELFWTAKNKLQWQNSLNWAKTVCCCGWKGRKIEMVCKWKKWSVNQTLDNLTWRLFSRHCYLPTICEHFCTNFKINQENESNPSSFVQIFKSTLQAKEFISTDFMLQKAVFGLFLRSGIPVNSVGLHPVVFGSVVWVKAVPRFLSLFPELLFSS